MTRKIKNQKTPEQRRAEAEQLQAAITEQVEALRDSDQWRKMLDFMRQFHSYSVNNLILIFSQKPEASHVAGYRKWQQLGRQVSKGEKGIRIFGGREQKVTEEDETGEETTRRRMVFFPVSVFDISQTEEIEGAEPVPTLAQRLTGEDPQGITAAVTDWLTGQGWTVSVEPIPGETNGYTTTDGTKRIVIDSALSPAQAAKTALHEAAHALLHATEEPAEAITHRGTAETEAESVAYVVAGLLGMDTSSYSIGYIAGWSQADADLIKSTAANVLKAAHSIIEGITVEASAPEAAAA